MLAVLAVWLTVSAGWAEPAWSADPATPPMIVAAGVSFDGTMLVLEGVNFGSANPTVRLGTTQLTVRSARPTFASMDLPANQAAGSYLVSLTRAGDNQVALFWVTLGAVGPAGPAGDGRATRP